MKKINEHELTPEQRDLLEYFKKPRRCTRCEHLIEPDADMIDLSGVVRLLEFWQSVSSAKDVIDSTPAFCPKCWRENQARAEQRWGLSSDVGTDQGSVVDFALSEIYDICNAIEESLSHRMCDSEFVEEYGRADWLVGKMALPHGGWLILEKPYFETEPDSLSEIVEDSFKLFWRLQNLLIEAYGGVSISAEKFFPTKGLREWGQQYERQVGFEV